VRRALLLLFVLGAAACRTAQTATPPEGDAATTGAEATAAVEPAAAQVAPIPKELPAILATVNGESVERWELEMAMREIEAIEMHPIPASQRDKVARAVLDRLIGHHLVAQEARARNLRVSEADVDRAIDEERKEFTDNVAFEQSLKELGTSLDELRRERQRWLEVERFVRADILPTIAVDAADVETYYRDNLNQYQIPESISASHILIRIYPDSTAQQKSAARAKADTILTQLKGGANFERVARQESQDRDTAENGGALGRLERGGADPAFEAAAFALKAGELSGVVETPFGFHVIKSTQHEAARTRPLSEVRSDIESVLSQDVQQAKLLDWVKQAKAKAKIEIFI
jgi:parvulin-like peptidyl-prolyl isomerase